MAPRPRKPAPSNPRARPSSKPTDKPGSGPSRPRRPAARPDNLGARQTPGLGVQGRLRPVGGNSRTNNDTGTARQLPGGPSSTATPGDYSDRRISTTQNSLQANYGAVGRLTAQVWEKRSSSKTKRKK